MWRSSILGSSLQICCKYFSKAFKNVFFQEQLSLTASGSPLKSVNWGLPEVIYWKKCYEDLGDNSRKTLLQSK